VRSLELILEDAVSGILGGRAAQEAINKDEKRIKKIFFIFASLIDLFVRIKETFL
jgi:hypothetical protein